MSSISDSKSTSYKEDVEKQVWKYAMTEKYHSIMKNDVWDIIHRPDRKSVVTSRWIYKIKHATNDSVEKYKAKFVAHVFYKKIGH